MLLSDGVSLKRLFSIEKKNEKIFWHSIIVSRVLFQKVWDVISVQKFLFFIHFFISFLFFSKKFQVFTVDLNYFLTLK